MYFLSCGLYRKLPVNVRNAYAHETSIVDPSGNTALYLLKIIPVATVIRWIFHVLQ
jgi:hypothetical protein